MIRFIRYQLFLLALATSALAASAEYRGIPAYNAPQAGSSSRFNFSAYDGPVKEERVIPEWPFHGRLFSSDSYASLDLSFQYADQSYLKTGELSDSSAYWFTKNPLQVQDVLLTARLLRANNMTIDNSLEGDVQASDTKEEVAAAVADHYYNFLADHSLDFAAGTYKQHAIVRYSHTFAQGKVYGGIEIPLVRAHQTARLKTEFSAQTNATLKVKNDGGVGKFADRYPDGLNSFFHTILNDKSFDKDLEDTRIGVGDITVFVNTPLNVDGIDAGMLGGYVRIPSAQVADVHQLIPAYLGSYGTALDIGVNMGFCWSSTPLFNPHFYSYAQYSPTRLVTRRTPRTISHASGGATTADIILSSGLRYASYSSFTEPDSSIPAFSTKVRSVYVRKGAELGAQIGNIFNHVLLDGLSVDCSYRFKFKANDQLGRNNFDTNYSRDLLVKDSYQIAHTVSGLARYHRDDSLSFVLGCDFVFGGRNHLRTIDIKFGVTSIF
jgi:hypothetical protein